MDCEVVVSREIPDRFRSYAVELLGDLGPYVSYNAKRYTVRRPIIEVSILKELEYDAERANRIQRYECLDSGFEPAPSAYKAAQHADSVDIDAFYGGRERVVLENSLAFFCPQMRFDGPRPMDCTGHDFRIFICPDKIIRRARELESRVPEVKPELIERFLFRIALTHEVGHYYTLGNFSTSGISEISQRLDLNILEGLANWFAYMILGQEERWILCEHAVDQRVCYRYFLYFKHADMSKLLDAFLGDSDYSKAPGALGFIIGGRLDINGAVMNVGNDFNGVAMDWDGKGGTIIAGGKIMALATMNSGVFISPKIESVIGRFPRNVRIVANEIPNIVDYGKVPDNITVIPRDRIDLAEAIKRRISDESTNRATAILRDIGLA